MKKIFNSKYEKGFTLIETLVAITILMIAIAGPLTIASKGLLAALYSRDYVMASYLAQDAMEFVKSLRDFNTLNDVSPDGWLQNIGQCDDNGNNRCAVETYLTDFTVNGTNGIVKCSNTANNACILYLKPDGYYHIHDCAGNSAACAKRSKFVRKFWLAPAPSNNPNERIAIVEVSWTTGTVNNVFILRNNIFNILK